jgi:ElaB/YqjD/DUF883 family membrane-anchored ribosome-binding protein
MSQSANMKRHVRAGAKEVRHAARQLRDTANDEVHSVMQSARKAGDHFNEAVRTGVNNLRESASDYLDQGRAKAQSMEEAVEQRIANRPLQSILIALGLGFLIGLFCTRRS